MKKDGVGYDLYYDFEYKGHKDSYSYEVPFDKFMEAVRSYFDDYLVVLDGKDGDVFNVLSDLLGYSEELVDTICYKKERYLKDICKEDAYEEFKDYVDNYLEEDE